MGKFLTREQILNAADVSTEEVAVPEWGGTVLVKALTGSERDRFEASMFEMRGRLQVPKIENARAKLVARSIVDEDMNPIFSEADIETLGTKSAAALDRVFSVASRLSRISDQDVDELTKN